MPELRIGCSGFNYWHWRGKFYPRDLPQRRWFEYYARVFSSVELNVTFYRLPLSSTYDKWYKETPPGFAFSLKGSRFITHVKRLIDVDGAVALFFDRALKLGEKLRIVLWQFPPAFKSDVERLNKFLACLRPYPVRNSLEFRHHSWITDEVIHICEDHNTSLCIADWPEFLDSLPITSDAVYIRRHGENGNYATEYSVEELQKDAKMIKSYLRDEKELFIYFNNDAQGYAPKNAKELMEMLK
ncbi:MAG: DUF72 domain-containing protein [Dissulfurispiraceae bacterium]